VTISVTVANTGDLSDTYEVRLKIDGAVVETEEVTLEGGDSERLVFTTAKDTAGTYTVDVGGLSATFEVKEPLAPAAFTISNLSISPAEVDVGESVTISVTVANTGDLSDTYEVRFKIDDTVVETEEVTLEGGDSERLVFTTAKDTAGTYTVDVNGLSGSFVASEKAMPSSPQTINWPILSGVIAGVIIVGLIIFFVARRRAYY